MKTIEMEMKDIFKPFGGANLPRLLESSQYRFSDASNTAKRFSFYPNRHVTSIVFEAIESNMSKKRK